MPTVVEQRKVAVITGASTGFGRQTAEAFVRNGYRTFGTVRDAAGRNAKAAAELKALGIDVVELDVTIDASVEAGAAHVLDATGHVDVLVNNAGLAYFGFIEAFKPETVARQYETNVFGPLRVNRAFLPTMRAQKSGLIVYVSSVVGRMIVPGGGVYNSSKFALEALAEATSYELHPFGIDVAIVQPGAYDTNIGSVVVGPDDQSRLSDYAPVGFILERLSSRLAASSQGKSPSDVADAIFALAERPAGTRPLRTVVGGDPRITQINEAIEPIQNSLMNDFGLSELLPEREAAAR